MAVRAEDTLREHLAFQSERKNMRSVIQRSQAFNKGFKETIASKDTELNQQDEESKQALAKESHQIKRVSQISENLKFGRGKKTAKLFKEMAGEKSIEAE